MRRLALFAMLFFAAGCTLNEASTTPTALPVTLENNVEDSPTQQAADPTPMTADQRPPDNPTDVPVPGVQDEVGQPSFDIVAGDAAPFTLDTGSFRYAFNSRYFADEATDDATNIAYSLVLSDEETAYETQLAFSGLASGEYKLLEYTEDTDGVFAAVIVPDERGNAIIYNTFPDGTLTLRNDGVLLDATFNFTITSNDPNRTPEMPETINVRGTFTNMPSRP